MKEACSNAFERLDTIKEVLEEIEELGVRPPGGGLPSKPCFQ